ncbi:hypothetical protein OG824_05395 [Streptomyces prunicolor]|uniref:hypothetical protein n=1 Tax=Streptomyces prunicolor TaxID=67348 RepID=UPI00225AEF04|nr:hypothetical protein [Streptomyces prunicolor]MCX5234667.1 hypothetical protein [Streptomyces prunicolor]
MRAASTKDRARATVPHGPELGRLTEAPLGPWDPEPTRALTGHGTAVAEELVADVLPADLTEAIR